MGAVATNPNGGSNKSFYKIIGGTIVQSVSQAEAMDESGEVKKGYQARSKDDGTIAYEKVFQGGIEGYITAFDIKDVTFGGGKSARFLEITMSDDEENCVLSIPLQTSNGNFSRFAGSVADQIGIVDFGSYYRLNPYSFKNENDRPIMGVTLYMKDGGGEIKTKDMASYELHIKDKPQPVKKMEMGAEVWDWKEANNWQYNQLVTAQQRLAEFLQSSSAPAPSPAPVPSSTPPPKPKPAEVTETQVEEMVGASEGASEKMPWE